MRVGPSLDVPTFVVLDEQNAYTQFNAFIECLSNLFSKQFLSNRQAAFQPRLGNVHDCSSRSWQLLSGHLELRDCIALES